MQLRPGFLSLMCPGKRPHSHSENELDLYSSFPRKRHNSAKQLHKHTLATEDIPGISPQDIDMEDAPIATLPPVVDCVEMNDKDGYLAQNDSSDEESGVIHDTEHDYDGTSLVKVNINGVSLPMERRSGEKKLRIPSFVLQSKQPDADFIRRLQSLSYTPPAPSRMGDKEPCHQPGRDINVESFIYKEAPDNPRAMAMDID